MKVLFLTNIPSPYRVNFFNELGKHCELTVVFERISSKERDKSWENFNTPNFEPVHLKGIKQGVANAFCPGIIKYLKKKEYHHIIVSNFTSLTGMLAILWMRMRGISYWLESDGGFAKNGLGIKERVKRYFIKGASGYFSTAKEHDEYYLQYGAELSRIYRYPFTSLYKTDILSEPIPQTQKMELRKALNVKEDKMLVAVGQIIHRKGFDLLIDAMCQLPVDIGAYIIGGKPTQEYLDKMSENKICNVHFIEFLPKADLQQYYMAADLFVLPTREDIWGLVVNEAMAKGLPIVTTNRCIAGLELIKDPKVGRIIPVGDSIELAKAIGDIMEKYDITSSRAVLKVIQEYTFEAMAKRHIDILTKQ